MRVANEVPIVVQRNVQRLNYINLKNIRFLYAVK